MHETIEITQEELATYEHETAIPDFELGNSKLGIGVIMIMAAFVGIWGTTCLVTGLLNSASVNEVGRGILTAFTGM
jgi:hypothetical protein